VKQTQVQRTLAEFRRRGADGMTAYEAMQAGCGMRLPARIADLEALGYTFTDRWVTAPTRDAPTRVKRWYLHEEPVQQPLGLAS
jgi:hypothetical protein